MKLRVPADVAAFIGLLQQGKTRLIYFSIVHGVRCFPKVRFLTLLPGKDSFFYQVLQADKVWVSCKGGKGLVRGVTVTGGSQGEYLPVGLASFL